MYVKLNKYIWTFVTHTLFQNILLKLEEFMLQNLLILYQILNYDKLDEYILQLLLVTP